MQIYKINADLRNKEKQYKKIYNQLKKYDIISFDIFDTLLLRVVQDPGDVFSLVSQNMKSVLDQSDFREMRIQAQKEAQSTYGVKTKLIHIYDCMVLNYGLERKMADQLMQEELSVEKSVCIPNETVVDLIKDLRKLKKEVILTSDMYLDKRQLQQILIALIPDLTFDKIYISCEMGLSKYNGDLFKYIHNCYNKKIIHVGDYFRGDYLNAKRSRGFNSIYLSYPKKNYTQLDKFINCTVSDRRDEIYRWAYTEFAPALWCFCEWLEQEATYHKCKQLLFLTREGDFLRQLFEIYYKGSELNFDTLYTSRRSVLAASSDLNWDCIKDLFGDATVHFFSEVFCLNANTTSQKTEYNLNSNLVKNWTGLEKVKNRCFEYSKQQRKLLLKMLEEKYFLSGDIGIVDVGWKGSTQYYLSKIFNDAMIDAKLHGFYLGEFPEERYSGLDKHGYICSSHEYHLKESMLNSGFIFENLLSPSFGTTTGYKKVNNKVVPVLDDINILNDSSVIKAQNAIFDFFNKATDYRDLISIDRNVSLKRLFKHLNHPSRKLACMLGDIKWMDFDDTRYVARPKTAFYYFLHPKKLLEDIHYCGWNSAFCLRAFKLPLPYFEIYSKLKKHME